MEPLEPVSREAARSAERLGRPRAGSTGKLVPQHVAIVGGGASGVLLAAHLLDRDARTRVTIVEKRSELGAGAAYATNHPDHLLNVRASNMSAFPADPGHFARWLSREPASPGAPRGDACFAPRSLYRDYLASLLAPHLESGRLACRHREARRIVEDAVGLDIEFEDGESVRAQCCVVATGNEGPRLSAEPWRYDGWSSLMPGDIAPEAPVVVIGTGLTMVDRVMALLHAGHRGTITAVSRHGFQPQSHRLVGAAPTEAADVPVGATIRHLTRWLRRRAEAEMAGGGDWRSVVDGLRPYTQAIWGHLGPEERRRFLRHARSFWDVHRHRIAPGAADALAAARARGQLSILAARITGFDPDPEGVRVKIAHRGSGQPDRIRAVAVFECRGRSADITRTENPVLQALLKDGTARPDGLLLGLDVTQDSAVIRPDGSVSRRLYALGPVTAGVLWEIVAIPDIRAQAERLAIVLSA